MRCCSESPRCPGPLSALWGATPSPAPEQLQVRAILSSAPCSEAGAGEMLALPWLMCTGDAARWRGRS